MKECGSCWWSCAGCMRIRFCDLCSDFCCQMHIFRAPYIANTTDSFGEQLLIQSSSSGLTLNKWQINVRHLHSLGWWHTLEANVSPLAIPVALQVKPSTLSHSNDGKLETQLVSIKFPDSAFFTWQVKLFPCLPLSLPRCPANNKRWKQLHRKVKVWKLTSCALPPSDFSTSGEQRRWYPAGWLRASPSGRRPGPPSRTERRGTAVPSWPGCWSGRRPSARRLSPWWRWASFCWRGWASGPEVNGWSLVGSGCWRVEGAVLTQGQTKLSHGSSPPLRTALCSCLGTRRRPPVSQVTRLRSLLLQTDFARGETQLGWHERSSRLLARKTSCCWRPGCPVKHQSRLLWGHCCLLRAAQPQAVWTMSRSWGAAELEAHQNAGSHTGKPEKRPRQSAQPPNNQK